MPSGGGHIINAAFDKGLHIGRRDEPQVMTKFANLAAPEMRASTGFHRDNTGLQLAEEGQHLITSQLLSQHRPP
jgi:hypothetical protein